jgi:hypothetical protein
MIDDHTKIDDSMKKHTGDVFPSIATNYAATVANSTRTLRSTDEKPDLKPYVSQ